MLAEVVSGYTKGQIPPHTPFQIGQRRYRKTAITVIVQLPIELKTMTRKEKHKWTFTSRFRRHAFGWRSQVAIQRVKEAVKEIKSVVRKDPVTGAEGAVLFLEKVSPALAHVDSSSGAIGTAVNNAVETLAAIIARAPVVENIHRKWLDRLWKAIEEDDIPYGTQMKTD